jgi:tetratricopeptide (TPR) repeat protein
MQEPGNPGRDEIDALFKAGLAALGSGRVDDAQDCFTRLVERVPEHAGALNGLGLLAAQRNERAEAERFWRHAITVAPRFAAPYVNLGNLNRVTAPLEAIEFYQRGIALAPEDAQAVFGLASLLERIDRPLDAASLAEQALERFPRHPGLAALAARGLIEMGRAVDAREMLAGVDVSRENPRIAQLVHYITAMAEDRLDDPKAALEAAERGAVVLERFFEDAVRAAPLYLADARAVAAHYGGRSLPYDPDGAGGDLVFLVGFPYTGGDRLAKVLERHPKVSLKRDNAALTGTLRSIFGTPTIPRDLDAVEQADARAYFDRRFGARQDRDAVRIDFTPLHIAEAGFAAELFPAARFIVTRRDPVAACLAATLHGQELGPASANLSRFSDAAILAATIGDGWRGIRDALAPRTLSIDHGDLLNAPRETLARVLTFLGLDGAPAREAVTALSENVDIPIGDWRRYEPYLPSDALARLSKVSF